VLTFATGFEWNSENIIFRAGGLGSIVEIKRIQADLRQQGSGRGAWT
jgi:hypothetical protein